VASHWNSYTQVVFSLISTVVAMVGVRGCKRPFISVSERDRVRSVMAFVMSLQPFCALTSGEAECWRAKYQNDNKLEIKQDCKFQLFFGNHWLRHVMQQINRTKCLVSFSSKEKKNCILILLYFIMSSYSFSSHLICRFSKAWNSCNTEINQLVWKNKYNNKNH